MSKIEQFLGKTNLNIEPELYWTLSAGTTLGEYARGRLALISVAAVQAEGSEALAVPLLSALYLCVRHNAGRADRAPDAKGTATGTHYTQRALVGRNRFRMLPWRPAVGLPVRAVVVYKTPTGSVSDIIIITKALQNVATLSVHIVYSR